MTETLLNFDSEKFRKMVMEAAVEEEAVKPVTILGNPCKRVALIIVIVDISGSMRGIKNSQANVAKELVVDAIGKVTPPDIEMKIAEINFNDTVRVLRVPVNLEQYQSSEVECGGKTNYGAVFEMLSTELSREKMLKGCSDFFPSVIFVTDGYSTSNPEEEQMKLEKLKENKWFQNAYKTAIFIHTEGATEGEEKKALKTLEDFTGSENNVYVIDNVENIADKIVYETVSTVCTQIGQKTAVEM